MTQQIYHGDPSREHHFWVYPKYKILQNSQWDAYDPFNLCNNFTLLDANHCTDTQMYKCNGHTNEWHGGAGFSFPCFHGNVTMPHKVYHGDPNREHHFWIYPTNKPLINPQWEAYDPTHLCNNFSIVTANQFTNLRIYKCNGHPNGCHDGAECSHLGLHGNVTVSHKVYHGDPSREHHFWVYPANKPLINPQWDAYDPIHLCNNFTLLGINQSTHLRTYKCNGH